VIFAIDAVFAAILTPLGTLTFFWRYRLIVSTFATGVEIPGKVIEINAISKDYIVHYEYNIKGQVHQYHNRVKKSPYVKTLRPNQQVILLAHERPPHSAFIKELYLEYIK
jgi:hypothetical protein